MLPLNRFVYLRPRKASGLAAVLPSEHVRTHAHCDGQYRRIYYRRTWGAKAEWVAMGWWCPTCGTIVTEDV